MWLALGIEPGEIQARVVVVTPAALEHDPPAIARPVVIALGSVAVGLGERCGGADDIAGRSQTVRWGMQVGDVEICLRVIDMETAFVANAGEQPPSVGTDACSVALLALFDANSTGSGSPKESVEASNERR